jgi:hypothetical protein
VDFPDVEVVLMEYLSDLGYTVTSTPSDLADRLPVLRIQRVGGGSDEDTDRPRVTIQAFVAASSVAPRAAQQLSGQVRDRLVNNNGGWVSGPLLTEQGVSGVLLDEVSHDSGPIEYPWPDPAIRVAQSIFTLTIRL